ncbi:MAG TPA: 4-hydroxythreonine-4-phosphate dehydrogenase PdxA [Acidiferrobacteraceae bacterium]|nr:4-hydroxythreonine-4-phosphate dehydrogenase PdxA [Acidiferrobacteraceae bacterium]
MRPVIAITAGEPAGIGPELVRELIAQPWDADLVVVGDADVLRGPHAAAWPAAVRLESVPLAVPAHAGVLDARNSPAVLAALERAIDGCLEGRFDALVTGPVHKGVINDAGIPFTGHTEFLAARSGTPLPVMLLAIPGLRVALVTTHLPLRAVADAITRDRLTAVLRIVHADMQRCMGIVRPRILVLGLNPHAGEGGHLGREEIEVLEPVIRAAQQEGLRVTGPVPADTAFGAEGLAQTDVVLAMYHDQGLPPLKQRGFGSAVNITLGLPFIRTSVDHGTALALAGTGHADVGSFRAALQAAIDMVRHVRAS